GLITDILAVMLANEGGFPVKITSLTNGRYGIAVSPGSSVRAMKDLAGRSAAISLNTIIHYFTDWSTEAAGLPSGSVTLVPVPKMPVRMEMLLAGQIDAAVMPEPFLTAASLRGARVLISSDDEGLEAGVLAFRSQALQTRLDAIRKFYRAYWEAAQRINSSPERYRRILIDSLGFPEDAAKVFVFPVYKKPALPSNTSMERAGRWLLGKGLAKTMPVIADLVDLRAISGW
ncbi:MAG: ABC transporter substrate-binding protein, partial [Rectinema sp.]|nr:ABC transporter substrate-binding protein [Rectinema sp.]